MFYVLSVSVIKHTFKVVHLLLISLSFEIQNYCLLVTLRNKLQKKTNHFTEELIYCDLGYKRNIA